MSGGAACPDRTHAHYVKVRHANYSAFNGGRRQWSRYSELFCPETGRVWRTDAAYADRLPDIVVYDAMKGGQPMH